MNVLTAARYGIEIACYTPQFREEVAQLPLDESPVAVSASAAGSAVFGAAIYDLAFAGSRSNAADRVESRYLSGLSMMYMNVLDDAIDDPVLSLPQDQKDELIHESVALSWNTDTSRQIRTSLPKTGFFTLAQNLGSTLRSEVSARDINGSYTESIREFAKAEAAHGQDQTPGGLLKSVTDLGKPCGNIMSSVVEVVTGKHDPVARRAAEGLGVYGMLLDHAFEINADLRDNSSTIVTAILKRDGDSPQNRKAARELCLDYASDALTQGKQDLDPGQKRIYTAMSTLFNARYKAIVRVKDALIR